MLSHILDRISFWSLFLVVVLIPMFFLPFSGIPVETSKSLLVVVGLAISVIFYAAARFSDGKLVIPRSWILMGGLGVALSFLVSALLSTAKAVSFFGVMFDVGTFWFMFTAVLLMFVSALIIRDQKKSKMLLAGLVASSAFVLFFQVLRFFAPEALSLGVLGGKTSNIFGSWNSFGLFVGFSAVISLFAVEFLHLNKKMKLVFSSFIVFSMLMAIIVNFYLVWELVGIFALLIFVYKISLSSGKGEEDRKNYFPAFSFGVVMVSLLFFMSGQFIGGVLPNKLGLGEIEISPSLSSTMSVSFKALKADPIFGVGPNRFGEVWSLNKPVEINGSQFWSTTFDSGSGLIPSFVATNGVFGVLAWLIFIFLMIATGVKMLFTSIKKRESSETSLFFIGALYLFVASFLYPTGISLFLLAFAMLGVFIGLSSSQVDKGEVRVSFLDDPRKSFFSILFLVLIMIVTAAATFKFTERFASVYYFQKAVSTADLDKAEANINNALALHSNDMYLRAYSQIYLARLSTLATKEGELTEEEKAQLKNSLDLSVNGAKLAIDYNPANYLNHQELGSVYQSTGLFGAPDAFTNAVEAYKKASELNPNNPGLKLSIATVHLSDKKLKEAKESAIEALTLKPDYVDAMIIMSRIEKESGNNADAIAYAEAALSYLPTNQDLKNYVTSLKNGTPVTAPVIKTEDGDKETQ